MTKAQYDHLPLRLEAVGNGSHLYRWGIVETTNPENQLPIWECYEVIVWNEPTREKVVEAAMLESWGVNIEAKLINDYNGACEGLLPESYKQPYFDFINGRNELKNEIKAFFATL